MGFKNKESGSSPKLQKGKELFKGELASLTSIGRQGPHRLLWGEKRGSAGARREVGAFTIRNGWAAVYDLPNEGKEWEREKDRKVTCTKVRTSDPSKDEEKEGRGGGGGWGEFLCGVKEKNCGGKRGEKGEGREINKAPFPWKKRKKQ